MSDFAGWLGDELASRGWKPNELARRSGVDSGLISRMLNGKRSPGPGTALSLAKALNLPPQTVFRAAGILPPLQEADPLVEQAAYKLSLLSTDEQRQVLDYIDFLLNKRSHRSENDTGSGASSSD